MIPTSGWVIQLVFRSKPDRHNGQSHYLPWAGYSRPMTGDQAMSVLSECEVRWPDFEFRAHTIYGDETRVILPGQSADWTHPAGL
jgi:hypothetical protein